MKSSICSVIALAALSVDAYVKNWNYISTPSDTLRHLQRRADTCPSDNPVSCSSVDSRLPSNFCCGKDTTCISIDQSSSAICCPKGQNCEKIGTVSCDVSLQDPNGNTGPLFTTNLDKTLPSCGDKCCPFGYICGQSGGTDMCVLDKAKSGAAVTTKVTSTSTTSATVTSTPTSLASGIDSKDPPPTKEASNFPTGVFFAGFFPGIVVGILATLAWVVLTKRNNKPSDNRGLNMSGTHGERPFISGPIKDVRHSNERSDFLGRTRTRARSMFSTHRRSRTVDSVDMWASKMPTPPTNNNVPVNYINDMQDVPVTPARRVARYHSDENMRATQEERDFDLSPVTPQTGSDSQRAHENAPSMPVMPLASVPPLRGMNTRRVSPPYGMATNAVPMHLRKDSGTAMGTGFGSPFQTPEKKPTIVNHNAPSMYATYHDATTLDSPDDDEPQSLIQNTLLTPARYEPKNDNNTSATVASYVPASAAAALATKNLTAAQKSLPTQQKPVIPPRPAPKRPETTYTTDDNVQDRDRDFDFDEGLDSPRASASYPYPNVSSARTPGPPNNTRVDPAATFDSLLPPTGANSEYMSDYDVDKSRKDKHATNATTFTTMLRNVGFPDPGNQLAVPAVPKVYGGTTTNVNAPAKKGVSGKKNGMKGMI